LIDAGDVEAGAVNGPKQNGVPSSDHGWGFRHSPVPPHRENDKVGLSLPFVAPDRALWIPCSGAASDWLVEPSNFALNARPMIHDSEGLLLCADRCCRWRTALLSRTSLPCLSARGSRKHWSPQRLRRKRRWTSFSHRCNTRLVGWEAMGF